MDKMTEKAAEIARGLTEAQRRLVAQLGDEWVVRRGQGHGAARMMYYQGVAEYRRAPNAFPERGPPARRAGVEHRLTPLGLAVRNILLSSENGRGGAR